VKNGRRAAISFTTYFFRFIAIAMDDIGTPMPLSREKRGTGTRSFAFLD
jgi:hypothetical protein